MHIDYLKSVDGRAHAINCKKDGAGLEIGIFCVIAIQEDTIRISNEQHSFLIELPKEFRSGSDKVKAFNVVLDILDHEQVQLSSAGD